MRHFSSSFRDHYSGNYALVVEDPKWLATLPVLLPLIKRITNALGGEGNLVLANDRAIQKLNFHYRGKNKPTNVLTFEHPAPFRSGDIIVALQTTQKEARIQNKSLSNHFAHLLVHAILHLQGHDHHHVGDARRMEMKESHILATLGIPNPWKQRHFYEQPANG